MVDVVDAAGSATTISERWTSLTTPIIFSICSVNISMRIFKWRSIDVIVVRIVSGAADAVDAVDAVDADASGGSVAKDRDASLAAGVSASEPVGVSLYDTHNKLGATQKK